MRALLAGYSRVGGVTEVLLTKGCMQKHFQYLGYLLRHKFFVLKASRLVGGVPLWRALLHDWSKFLPSEWGPYVRYFYGPNQFNGRHRPEDAPDWFNRAWLYHQRRNRHHWQYWLLRLDTGRVVPMRMPDTYVHEMVSDWVGAGLAQGKGLDVHDWYETNKEHMLLHDDTRFLVEIDLALLRLKVPA